MKNILILGLLIVLTGVTFGVATPAFADGVSATDTVLSVSEADGLVYMREEEKLAHDVYVTLYAQWGLPVFDNIANSEATHTAAIKTLLDIYGIADPAAGKGVGEFTNPDLQKLYDEFVAQGSQSLTDALKVGAAIEEVDIRDLQTRLAKTSSADIKLVYNNLMRGSENHLQAFTTNLQRQTGETYSSQGFGANSNNSVGTTTNQRGGRRWSNR